MVARVQLKAGTEATIGVMLVQAFIDGLCLPEGGILDGAFPVAQGQINAGRFDLKGMAAGEIIKSGVPQGAGGADGA